MYFEIRETDIDRHLQTDDARSLLAVWRSAAVAGTLPDLAAFWSEDIAMRPYMMAVFPVEGGDWRYSRVGARLEEETGDHWRTELVSQIGNPDRSFISRCFELTASRAEPVYAIHSAPNTHNVLLWERLERRFLPLRAYEALVLPRRAYMGQGYPESSGLQVAMVRRADRCPSGPRPANSAAAARVNTRIRCLASWRA